MILIHQKRYIWMLIKKMLSITQEKVLINLKKKSVVKLYKKKRPKSINKGLFIFKNSYIIKICKGIKNQNEIF